MAKALITNKGELIALFSGISQSNEYPLKIEYKIATKRSITANAQVFVWYPKIAEFYGEDVEFIRKWMKKDIAFPILESGESDYSIKVRYMLTASGYDNLAEKRKREMVDMFGITRLFTTKEHNEFRDMIQIFWGKQGLNLEYLNGQN